MRQILLFAALATSLALLSGCTLSKTKADTAEDAPGMRGERGDAEKALACLGPAMRGPVVLVVMQGLTHAEAAEVLGIPTGTVKSRISAAMRQMRIALEAPGATRNPQTDAGGRQED